MQRQGKQNRKKQSGLSLVEVLVALAIFALGGLMVMMTTTSSLKVTSDSRDVDEGVNVARQKLETLLGLDYNDADLLDTNADGVAGLPSFSATDADHSTVAGRYLVAWNIAANTPVNNSKTVAVTASWQAGNRTRKVVFQTIITE